MTVNTPDILSPPDFPTDTLVLPDGTKLAYSKTGGSGPGVVFLHGLRSDMDGDKATTLHAHCAARNIPFVRFDMTGHGRSSGNFTDGCISRWTADTLGILDHLCDGPQLLVGSSMGGWAMVCTALSAPERVAGLLGIAPAPDFTEDMMWRRFSDDQRATIERDENVIVPCDYDGSEPFILTPRLFADGRDNLVLQNPIPLTCPVHILHGQLDKDVPYDVSLKLLDQLESPDVEITLVKSGDHRLSGPRDLARLCATFDLLYAKAINT